MGKNYDFGGWATRNDLKCSDGRTIRHGAFKDNDGCTVPLVWNHQHNEPTNVLGHALLENRDEGVYAYCTFNETEYSQNAKELVEHGDITALSIYANQLKQVGGDVLHGAIREVSLVLAGANPGAFIDSVLAHGEFSEEEAVIYTGFELSHSCEKKAEPEEKKDEDEEEEEEEEEMTDEEKSEKELEKKKKEENAELSHSEESEKETVQDIIDSMNDKQKNVMYALIGEALNNGSSNKESKEEEKTDMGNIKHNVFDQDEMNNENVLSHSEMETIISDAKRCGSLKESVIQHSAEYGIDNIDWLFPEARNLTNQPEFIKRNPEDWVSVVMNGVHHTPFSRIKMMFADLREDDARAKGYAQKGKLKKEEVFGLIKRTVEPTTIYKKQKLDRDDVIDITDFDVVAWLKGEMRMMLDEEIARAILFGDGRSASSDDKIKETNIIPIIKDASLYTLTETLPTSYTAKDIIKAAVKGQNDYEGGGNTILFVGNSTVTDMLLIEDHNERRIYNTVADLALGCSVNKIVKVPDSIIPTDMVGLIVDLNDYNVGADKGGSINMFDDFDIDYNQQKYLIETRCSGALTKPFSAVVIKKPGAAG